MQSLPKRILSKIAHAPRTAGVVLAAALFTAACGDGAPAVTSPVLNLRTANASEATSSFAVLANAAVTCTNGTIIGDVGTYLAPPAGSITKTICPVTGTKHVGDAFAQAAYEAFVLQYDALTPADGECTNIITGTLAGVSLAPGTYCVSAEAKTGVLTLTGSGPWTFKVLGALTGNSFTVVLEDPSKACNVTWWVAEAATMTTSNFIGTIMAGAAITLTGGTFAGNAYSQADVTVTGTAVTGCDAGSSIPGGKEKCNQGVGNGPEGCDPGKSNHNQPSNDEPGTKGNPGRKP